MEDSYVTGSGKILHLVDHVVILTTLDHKHVLLPEGSELTWSTHLSLVADQDSIPNFQLNRNLAVLPGLSE